MNALNDDKQQYECDVFSSRNFGDLYRYFKSVKGSSTLPDKMHWNQLEAATDIDKADLFNKYFASVYNPLSHDSSPLPDKQSHSTIHHITITNEAIEHICAKMKISVSTGPDSLPNCIFKHLYQVISPSLLLLFKTCTCKGLFPSVWKESVIVPIFKDGNKSLVSCYRRISLLPAASKIFERVIFNKLYDFVSPKLSSNQFGYLRNQSAVLQLLQYLDNLYDKYDHLSVNELLKLYVDFEKAFDRVSHSVLIRKLHQIGVKGKLLSLVTSYLTGRSQRVRVGEKLSQALLITSGVPQGSILGPLLFLIYLNDLLTALTCLNSAFADDIKLWSTSFPDLSNDANTIIRWCADNYMSINPTKSKTIWFRGTPRDVHCSNLTIHHDSKERDLGVFITDTLSWSHHTNFRVSKASKSLLLIKRNTSDSCASFTKPYAYCGFIVPVLLYGSPVYCANRSELKNLEQATKLILNFTPLPYKQRLAQLALLPICLYIELHDLLLFSSILNGKYDYDSSSHVRFSAPSTTRSTTTVAFHVKNYRYTKCENNFWNRCSRLAIFIDPIVNFHQPAGLKQRLTRLYKNFATDVYDTDNLCTWKMHCRCSNCRNSPSLRFRLLSG